MSYEYLLSTLPALEISPPKVPDISTDIIYQRLQSEEGRVSKLAFALFLSFDILYLEDLNRKLDIHLPVIFKKDQLERRDEIPYWLEFELEGASGKEDGYGFSSVWQGYYESLLTLAAEEQSDLFQSWVEFDYNLRKTIERVRSGERVTGVEEFKEAFDDEDPFKLDKLLMKHRLQWLNDLSPSYTFDENEVLGYILKYITLLQGSYLIDKNPKLQTPNSKQITSSNDQSSKRFGI